VSPKPSQIILKNLQKLSANSITSNHIPVIAIDGPSASGKGTVAEKVADLLGFHYLDSGALYRVTAFAAYRDNIEWNQADALGFLAKNLDVTFKHGDIFLEDDRITEAVRSEEISRGASEVAIHPPVRQALLQLQHNFRRAPGLVADGRDIGSVVFKDAALKIFLTASTETRAERRYQQLINKGVNANLAQILADLQQRDLRDSQRSASPLIQTPDALLLDTTNCSIDDAVKFVISAYEKSKAKIK
jgi:CMP/dCMP kinase